MKDYLDSAADQHHPLRKLKDFFKKEQRLDSAKMYEQMRFVGYVLDIGYGEVTIITSDPFKIAVGGIPRNSLLIMCPTNFKQGDYHKIPPHFTILRVLDAAPTPLTKEVQQTYFELQKKSMPELDVFTTSELQWGALKTAVLGMIYSHPDQPNAIEFSGDLNNFVSAHKYEIYSPDDDLLDLIVNSIVPKENRFKIGHLRLTECRLPLPNKQLPNVDVFVSTTDFMGTRTAMFGKTRLGKSNVVKLIVQSLIETTKKTKSVGQLIFDINGEYANDNPQDGNLSIASVYTDRCEIYALNKKQNTSSKPLKLNFYLNAAKAKQVIASLINESNNSLSNYVKAFLSVELMDLEEINTIQDFGDKSRAIRKIQYYWAILKKAGFPVNESKLRHGMPRANQVREFSPNFKDELRKAAYEHGRVQTPNHPNSLAELQNELEIIARFKRDAKDSKVLKKDGGESYFDAEESALLEFLEPAPGRSGITILLPYKMYHDTDAGNFVEEILTELDKGKTVIIDLGNANETVMRYFSRELSESVFRHQTDKFTNNALNDHYIQIYFEEAHNLFSANDTDEATRIYRRFAKEGAKYHIGMVYSTQSPTTISNDLLAQTENFFIAHLASQDDVNRLAKVNIAYETLKYDILQSKTQGYMRMLTRSHRFVVSMQAQKFEPLKG